MASSPMSVMRIAVLLVVIVSVDPRVKKTVMGETCYILSIVDSYK